MTNPRTPSPAPEAKTKKTLPPKAIPTDNDVVVIGSGLGGLTCALALARNGLKVCVLEQHRVAGGYAHSFRRRGYHFDISLHYIGGLAPGNMTHGVLSSLGVFDKLNIHRRDIMFTADFPEFVIALPNNFDGIMDILASRFPSERSGLNELFKDLKDLKFDVFSPALSSSQNVPLEDHISTKYLESSFLDLLLQYVKDPKLLAMLGQLWMFIGLPPSLSCATFSTCVFCSSFVEEAYDITGGGEALVRALVERLREFGSECVTRVPVSRIAIEGGKTVGVLLDDGQFIPAKAVVSNANPYQTFFEMIPGDEISKLYRYRLSQMQKSASLYALYLGLDCLPSQLGLPHGNCFYNHAADCEDAYRRAMEGDIDHTDWCVTNYEKTESAMCPPGAGICSFAEVTPAGNWLELNMDSYKIRKQEVQDRLIAKYEKRFPGLRDHIVVSEFATPRTMNRYTRNPAGAVYGLAQTIEQSNSKRLRNRSPIDGLYLTGAWTWSGGGYEGAMMTGIQTADAVIREMELKNPILGIQLGDLKESTPLEGEAKKLTFKNKRPKSLVNLDPNNEYFRFIKRVDVYGDDLNSRGNADASSYLRYMDRGRVEAIEQACREAGKESWLTRFIVNVYKIDMDCATVISLGNVLEVRTGLRKTSSHRTTFDQRIVDLKTGSIVADGAVEVLFLDKNRALVPVPIELIDEDALAFKRENERQETPPFGDEAHFPFRIVFRVYYEDTDCQGITYHVAYARFCERALFDMVKTVWPEIGTKTWMSKYKVSVARMNLRYLNSSTLGDNLEVRTGVLSVSSHLLTMGQRITFAETGKIVADITTEVEFRNDAEEIVPIPAQIIDAVFTAIPHNGESI